MGTRFETIQEFAELYPVAPPEGIETISLDAENVLTPYGNPTLLPGILDHMARLQGYGIHLVVATNNQNQRFLNDLGRQFKELEEAVPVLSARIYQNKKKGPEMFLAAAGYFRVDPRHAAHVDDQFLSLRGARMAGFGTVVLARPEGPNGHKGVKLGRPLDASARLVIAASQGLRHLWTDGIDG